MNIFVNILCYTLMIVPTKLLPNEHLKVLKTGVEKISPCSVGLVLFADVNNTSKDHDFDAELNPDRCCLKQRPDEDCEVLQVVGDCVETLPKGKVSTVKLVVPTLEPFERHGYCTAFLDTKVANSKRNVMRNNIAIPFDTRVAKLTKTKETLPVTRCRHADENPFNNCKPVDCHTFYNEKKPFYNRTIKRCTEAPECVSGSRDIPDCIYDPVGNRCMTDSITAEDLKSLKRLTRKIRIGKDVVIISNLHDIRSNMTDFIDISEQKKFNFNVTTKVPNEQIPNKNTSIFNRSMFYISSTFCGVSFLFILLLVQCFCICTLIYLYISRHCTKKDEVVLEKTYINMLHDASVTTPLIGMATADTETTCQYRSDSSNVDKRIQCYKSCQKENPKICLSDDILSKCINRRDWSTNYPKSEAVEYNNKNKLDQQNNYKTLYVNTKKASVNFETETKCNEKKSKSNSIKKSSIVKKVRTEFGDCEIASSEKEINCFSYGDLYSKSNIVSKQSQPSEREIRCHSYNYMENSIMNLKESSHSYSDERSAVKEKEVQVFTTSASKPIDGDSDMKGQASAQASFSNDSIDDFLSERGLLLLAGENLSQYSFSDDSIKTSLLTSNRTSKNNVIKNVISYFKRDKHGPSSDPGTKRTDSVNLELIHMSKATMYSSSNNDNECLKVNQKPKDSRTSL